MDQRNSPLFWSFPCGSLFRTNIRVSFFFPLIVLVVVIRLNDLQLGLVFGLILFFSILCHEFGHVFAARKTGGSGDEILLWPLGGLAFVQPASTLHSQILTSLGGPFVNLLFCVATLPWLILSGHLEQAINPLAFPSVELSEQILGDLVILFFFANWIALLINLVPVHPLDGGQVLKTCLNHWIGERAVDYYFKIGFLVTFAVMFAGLLLESTFLVFIGAVVFGLSIMESVQGRADEEYDESFLGYDFSQGYTSLEGTKHRAREKKSGWWQRRKEQKAARKARMAREEEYQLRQELDKLLEKIQTSGMDSLTEAERRKLKSVSSLFKDKGQSE